MTESYFSVIFAVGNNGEFGHKNALPWGCTIKEDMKHFYEVTTDVSECKNKKNVVIMGRNTFFSMGGVPLKNRINIIVTSKLYIPNETGGDIFLVKSLSEALCLAETFKKTHNANNVFVIGGIRLLEESLKSPMLEYIHRTTVTFKYSPNILPDTIFRPIYPLYDVIEHKEMEIDKFHISFDTCKVYNQSPEYAYLNLCKDVITNGTIQSDRTGVGTIAKFAKTVSFDMRKSGFPLFTTKRIFWRGVVEELLFFLSGKTDTKVLEKKNVFIWKGNTSREYLDKYGFNHYPEGEMGPGYPFQWRHFGADWKLGEQLELDSNKGVDQIKNVIENIKRVKENPQHPAGRRLVVSAWNPIDMPNMVLAPCHFSFVFAVDGGELHCTVNMRSSDLGCGLGFNVASYALLTYMICNITNLTPGTLTFNLNNAHIYLNHVDAIKEQLKRPPRRFPMLEFSKKYENIDDFTADSIILNQYDPHPPIKMEMAK